MYIYSSDRALSIMAASSSAAARTLSAHLTAVIVAGMLASGKPAAIPFLLWHSRNGLPSFFVLRAGRC